MKKSPKAQEAVASLARGALRAPPNQAWSQVDAAWPVLLRFVLSRLGRQGFPRFLWEDCVQAVMERVWKYRATYHGDGEASFWAWMYRICDNEARRMWAREKKQPLSESSLLACNESGGNCGAELNPFTWFQESDQSDEATNCENSELWEALKHCLAELGEIQALVIDLLYIGTEMTERAAAEVVGCSRPYVHKVKKQALHQLLKCLEGKGFQ
jgi:RNA polymerase sigma factor (sigma-70 family)